MSTPRYQSLYSALPPTTPYAPLPKMLSRNSSESTLNWVNRCRLANNMPAIGRDDVVEWSDTYEEAQPAPDRATFEAAATAAAEGLPTALPVEAATLPETIAEPPSPQAEAVATAQPATGAAPSHQRVIYDAPLPAASTPEHAARRVARALVLLNARRRSAGCVIALQELPGCASIEAILGGAPFDAEGRPSNAPSSDMAVQSARAARARAVVNDERAENGLQPLSAPLPQSAVDAVLAGEPILYVPDGSGAVQQCMSLADAERNVRSFSPSEVDPEYGGLLGLGLSTEPHVLIGHEAGTLGVRAILLKPGELVMLPPLEGAGAANYVRFLHLPPVATVFKPAAPAASPRPYAVLSAEGELCIRLPEPHFRACSDGTEYRKFIDGAPGQTYGLCLGSETMFVGMVAGAMLPIFPAPAEPVDVAPAAGAPADATLPSKAVEPAQAGEGAHTLHTGRVQPFPGASSPSPYVADPAALTPEQVLRVACPFCDAAPGNVCLKDRAWPEGPAMDEPHLSRYRAAQAALSTRTKIVLADATPEQLEALAVEMRKPSSMPLLSSAAHGAVEFVGEVVAEPDADEDDAERTWRRLALQFDGHRMQALGLLRQVSAVLDGRNLGAEVNALIVDVQCFLAAPPLSGEKVLAERIGAMVAGRDASQPVVEVVEMPPGPVIDADDDGTELVTLRVPGDVAAFVRAAGNEAMAQALAAAVSDPEVKTVTVGWIRDGGLAKTYEFTGTQEQIQAHLNEVHAKRMAEIGEDDPGPDESKILTSEELQLAREESAAVSPEADITPAHAMLYRCPTCDAGVGVRCQTMLRTPGADGPDYCEPHSERLQVVLATRLPKRAEPAGGRAPSRGRVPSERLVAETRAARALIVLNQIRAGSFLFALDELPACADVEAIMSGRVVDRDGVLVDPPPANGPDGQRLRERARWVFDATAKRRGHEGWRVGEPMPGWLVDDCMSGNSIAREIAMRPLLSALREQGQPDGGEVQPAPEPPGVPSMVAVRRARALDVMNAARDRADSYHPALDALPASADVDAILQGYPFDLDMGVCTSRSMDGVLVRRREAALSIISAERVRHGYPALSPHGAIHPDVLDAVLAGHYFRWWSGWGVAAGAVKPEMPPEPVAVAVAPVPPAVLGLTAQMNVDEPCHVKLELTLDREGADAVVAQRKDEAPVERVRRLAYALLDAAGRADRAVKRTPRVAPGWQRRSARGQEMLRTALPHIRNTGLKGEVLYAALGHAQRQARAWITDDRPTLVAMLLAIHADKMLEKAMA